MQLARLTVDKEVGLFEHVGFQQVDVLKVFRRNAGICKIYLDVRVSSIADQTCRCRLCKGRFVEIPCPARKEQRKSFTDLYSDAFSTVIRYVLL